MHLTADQLQIVAQWLAADQLLQTLRPGWLKDEIARVVIGDKLVTIRKIPSDVPNALDRISATYNGATQYVASVGPGKT